MIQKTDINTGPDDPDEGAEKLRPLPLEFLNGWDEQSFKLSSKLVFEVALNVSREIYYY